MNDIAGTNTPPDYYKYPMVQTYVSLARSYKMKGNIIDAFQRFERALDVCYMNNADVLMDDIRQQMIALAMQDDVPEDIRKRQMEIRDLLEIKEKLKTNDFETVRRALHALRQSGSRDPEIHIMLGSIALEENKKEEAAENLLKAAQYCYAIRAIPKAETFCKQVLHLKPENLEARALMTEIYRRQGATSEASIEMLSMVREHLKNNELDKAFAYVQKAVDVGNMEAHYIQGLIYFHEGNLEKAKEKFELVNKINERHTGALSFLARIYQKENKIDDALETYKRVVELEPNDPQVLLKLAVTQLKQGLREEAVVNYQKASQLYAQQGKSQEAEAAVRMADQLWGSIEEVKKPAQPLHDQSKQKIQDEKLLPAAETGAGSPETLPPGSQITALKPRIIPLGSGDEQCSPSDLNPISNDEHYTLWELVSLYQKALYIDPHNTNINEKIHALEQTLAITPIPQVTILHDVFMPVSGSELAALSFLGESGFLDMLKEVAGTFPSDLNLQSKIRDVSDAAAHS